MTIEQFINSNIQAKEVLSKQISYLEQGKFIYAVGQDPVKATTDWLEKLKKFRFELDTIITELLLHKSVELRPSCNLSNGKQTGPRIGMK